MFLIQSTHQWQTLEETRTYSHKRSQVRLTQTYKTKKRKITKSKTLKFKRKFLSRGRKVNQIKESNSPIFTPANSNLSSWALVLLRSLTSQGDPQSTADLNLAEAAYPGRKGGNSQKRITFMKYWFMIVYHNVTEICWKMHKSCSAKANCTNLRKMHHAICHTFWTKTKAISRDNGHWKDKLLTLMVKWPGWNKYRLRLTNFRDCITKWNSGKCKKVEKLGILNNKQCLILSGKNKL